MQKLLGFLFCLAVVMVLAYYYSRKSAEVGPAMTDYANDVGTEVAKESYKKGVEDIWEWAKDLNVEIGELSKADAPAGTAEAAQKNASRILNGAGRTGAQPEQMNALREVVARISARIAGLEAVAGDPAALTRIKHDLADDAEELGKLVVR